VLVVYGNGAKRINAMTTTLKTKEEEILTFDVSDEALEIAGTVSEKGNFTFGVCTFEQPGCPPSIVSDPARVGSRTDMHA
jgi:hypothetical protein